MNSLRVLLRKCGPLTATVTTLLLLGTLWLAGVHHHQGADGHGCAVCTLSHTPATPTVAVAADGGGDRTPGPAVLRGATRLVETPLGPVLVTVDSTGSGEPVQVFVGTMVVPRRHPA